MSIRCSSLSSVGAAVELRKSRRYRPVAPALFMWEGSDGSLMEGRGAIRDISDRGVYVTAELAPPLGARLDVDVLLPPPEAASNSVELHGEGTVVRIDREAEQIIGFAASVAFRTEATGSTGAVKPTDVN
jgi:PilZ domain